MTHSPSDDRRARRFRRENARTTYGIDLGHQAPLNPEGETARQVDRRDINLRWLGASVLTGLTGAALIGASIYIALEGATVTALPPERAAVNTAPGVDGSDGSAPAVRKADRLNRSETTVSAKQTFKAPMTIRTGDREAIKLRQFVRVATNLSLTAGTYASDIPPFNPLLLFAEVKESRPVGSAGRPEGRGCPGRLTVGGGDRGRGEVGG
jgi:hypothetical protein